MLLLMDRSCKSCHTLILGSLSLNAYRNNGAVFFPLELALNGKYCIKLWQAVPLSVIKQVELNANGISDDTSTANKSIPSYY